MELQGQALAVALELVVVEDPQGIMDRMVIFRVMDPVVERVEVAAAAVPDLTAVVGAVVPVVYALFGLAQPGNSLLQIQPTFKALRFTY
jgi:hypothetical protein